MSRPDSGGSWINTATGRLKVAVTRADRASRIVAVGADPEPVLLARKYLQEGQSLRREHGKHFAFVAIAVAVMLGAAV